MGCCYKRYYCIACNIYTGKKKIYSDGVRTVWAGLILSLMPNCQIYSFSKVLRNCAKQEIIIIIRNSLFNQKYDKCFLNFKKFSENYTALCRVKRKRKLSVLVGKKIYFNFALFSGRYCILLILHWSLATVFAHFDYAYLTDNSLKVPSHQI